MSSWNQHSGRYDSRSIALFSIFVAMVLLIELYPIPGITDIPVPGISFTIDPTGIPLILIFMFFGAIFSFAGLGIMGIAIGYRNLVGASFKFFAEFFKILGIIVAWWILRKRNVSYLARITIYTIFASIFCAIGMYFLNGFVLIPLLIGLDIPASLAFSALLVPWNIVQSVINVVGGCLIFGMIPENLRIQFRTVGDGSYSDEQFLELEEES